MRLILVRHGEPNYRLDCLTEDGKIQAEKTAGRLMEEGISEIYASPMGRAQETASYTADALGLEIQTLDFMHEIEWGSPSDDPVIASGLPWTMAEMLMSEPNLEENLANWRSHPCFKDNKCVKYYDLIAPKIDEFLKTQGFERKGSQYLCTRENKKTIALFSHGGSGGCALAHMLNISLPVVYTHFNYGYCSICILYFPDNVGQVSVQHLELFNDMRHWKN